MNYQDSKQYEIMAPVGSYESLAAAIDAVPFGQSF